MENVAFPLFPGLPGLLKPSPVEDPGCFVNITKILLAPSFGQSCLVEASGTSPAGLCFETVSLFMALAPQP